MSFTKGVMGMRPFKLFPAAGVFLWFVAVPGPAYAYLDAATGSIMLQALLGVIGGAAFYARAITTKVKSFFLRDSDSAGEAETK